MYQVSGIRYKAPMRTPAAATIHSARANPPRSRKFQNLWLGCQGEWHPWRWSRGMLMFVGWSRCGVGHRSVQLLSSTTCGLSSCLAEISKLSQRKMFFQFEWTNTWTETHSVGEATFRPSRQLCQSFGKYIYTCTFKETHPHKSNNDTQTTILLTLNILLGWTPPLFFTTYLSKGVAFLSIYRAYCCCKIWSFAICNQTQE